MKHEKRVLVIGLDGMGLSQARFMCTEFSMPNLTELIQMQGSRSIKSELPELSPVNWTSFFTGKGPERHGVFGFVNLDPKTYDISISDFNMVRSKTIFHELGEHNFISRVINLPNTYPAPEIKGVLISGFVAPDLRYSVYPKVYIPFLRQINYQLEADTTRGIKDVEYLFEELNKTLESRKRAIDLLWPDLAWNLFIIVFTEIDRINHFLYPAIFDKTHPYHGLCRSFFERLDKVIGDLVDRYYHLPENKRLMVVADHGFCELITEVDINCALKEAGLLRLEKRANSELDGTVISNKSYCFALDPGRIYIHKKEIFSKGRVDRSEYRSVSKDIISCIKELEHKGQKVIREVLLRDDIYPGSVFNNTPDIVLVPQKGFDLKAKFNRDQIFGNYGRFGTHFAGDVLFCDSMDSSNVNRVRDIGQEILAYFLKNNMLIT